MKGTISRETLLGGALIAALSGYPLLAAITDGLGTSNTPFSITYRTILAFTFLVLTRYVRRLHLDSPRDTIAILLLAFLSFYTIRIFYSTLIAEETLSRPVEFYWMWAVVGCILPSTVIIMQKRAADLFRIYFPVFFITFVTCILALLFGTTIRINAMGEMYSTGRFSLTALNPISLANVGITLCILSAWRLWVYPAGIARFGRLPLLASFPLGIYLMLITASRGPIISLIACLMVIFWGLRGQRKIAFLLLGLCFGTLTITLMLRNAETLEIMTISRIIAVGSDTDVSSQSRMVSFQSALADAVDNPIFGAQLEERITRWYPHNLFVEALMATGFISGFIFIIATMLILRLAVVSVRRRENYSWVSLIFIQHFVAGMFSSGLYTAIEFWVSGSIVYLAAIFPQRNRDGFESRHLKRPDGGNASLSQS